MASFASGTVSKRARTALALSVVVTAALYLVPYGQLLAYPLVLLSTLAHELGHGLMAVALGHHFEAFVMNADGSGVAMWAGDAGRIDHALIAAGGLVGPAVAAAALFFAGRRPRTARALLLLGGLGLLAAEILVVRNVFGWAFVGLVATISLGIALRGSPNSVQLAAVFLGVQLALSVFSRGDYLFTATAMTASGPMPSDVAHISEALLLPYWFWGGLVGVVSLAVLGLGVRGYVRA